MGKLSLGLSREPQRHADVDPRGWHLSAIAKAEANPLNPNLGPYDRLPRTPSTHLRSSNELKDHQTRKKVLQVSIAMDLDLQKLPTLELSDT